MKLLPKRMTFQLTPLLDLLLIVIFAQFMEMQQVSKATESRATDRETELQQEYDEKISQTRAKYDEAFKSILRQQDMSGKVLADLFDVPEKTVNEILKLNSRTPERSPEQVQQLKTTLRDLQKSNGHELLRAMINYGEMKKRCDIWEVHVVQDGVFEFSNGDTVRNFEARTKSEIEDGLFKVYKQFEEPKTLVIILFSYGAATYQVRKETEETLPKAIARMREDSGGRNWFEFAVMGFAPSSPSSRSDQQ